MAGAVENFNGLRVWTTSACCTAELWRCLLAMVLVTTKVAVSIERWNACTGADGA